MFNSRITSDELMHSNVSIQIDFYNAFLRLLHSSRKIPMFSRHVKILLQASNLCTNTHDHHKTVPQKNTISQRTRISLQCIVHPHSTTKMTLQQLDRPIGAVSPEYSGDRITNSKLIHKRMLAKFSPKQDRHNPTKAGSIHYTTSARLFEYAQSQKLSSLTSRK